MLWPCEYAYESPEDQLKTSLCFRRRQLRNGWLFADDVLQFRDEIDDQQPVRLECLLKCLSPLAQLVFALAEEWADKALERLRQCRIRNVPFVLVELARRKQASGRDERLVKFVHDSGLADTRVA